MLANKHIIGAGATATLIREKDWSTTALGSTDTWSETLLATVNMMLAAPVPMQLLWGSEFICIYNDAMMQHLYEKHPSLMGQPAHLGWSEAWYLIGPELEKVRLGGEVVSFENLLVPLITNGILEDRYWTFSYSPVVDVAGKIAGVLDIAQDTTKTFFADRAEQARQDSDKRLADFALATHDVLYQMNADWTVMSQLNGASFLADTQTADSKWLDKYIHPLDQPRVLAEIARAISTKTNFELEHRVVRADGSLGWTLSRAVPTLDANGDLLHWVGTARDDTGRRQAEEETFDSRTQLALALGSASMASWYYDPESGIFGRDKLVAELFGLPFLEGPVEMWLAVVVEEDRSKVGREFATSIEGAPYDTEFRLSVDGNIRWLRSKASLSLQGRATTRIVGICEDITERKRTEEDLRNTAVRLSMAQETGKMASWEWDLATGRFIWDGGSSWTFGRPPVEMTHVDVIFPYLHEEDRDKVREDLRPAIEGWGEYRSKFRVLWPDGSLHWIQAFGKSVLSPEGKPVAIVGINMDITESKVAEATLLQTEKLAAVGRLASSIAHEINNPLESVTNLLYLARSTSEPDALDDYLEMAERELRRVSAITNQTLRFYKQTTKPSAVSCSDLFTETLSLYQGRILNSGIVVEKRKRAERTTVCFVGEIRQVLSNLMVNAIDAMPQGGRLILRSREATNWRTGAKGLVLTIADTGTGMPFKVREKVFDAFFSTKGIGGTGLGLWVSKELVDKHQGTILIKSATRAESHGTVFALFLPFHLDEAAA